MPFGSNAALIRRISSSSIGGFTAFSISRLSWPMPCSAEIVPAKLAYDGVDHGVHFVPAGEERRLVHPHGLADIVVDVAVAQMAERERPAARDQRRHRRARPREELRDGGIGTATSCLIEPPSSFCTSDSA